MKNTLGILFLFISTLALPAQDVECEDWIGKYCLFRKNEKYGLYDVKKKKILLPAEYDSVRSDEAQMYYVIAWKNRQPYPYNSKLEPIKFLQNYASMKIVSSDDDQGAYLMVSDKKGWFIPVTVTKNYGIGDRFYVKGAIKVNDRLMVSEAEVTMKDWLMYMSHASLEMDVPLSQIMPDTLRMHPRTREYVRLFLKNLNTENDNNIELMYISFNNIREEILIPYPKSLKNKSLFFFENIPVTGITHQQAQQYCQWLTDQYNSLITSGQKMKVNIRLPSKEEWENFVRDGLSENMKRNNLFDSVSKDGCFLYNYKFGKDCKGYDAWMKKYGTRGIMMVREFFPNNMGIYNLFGNVAEMVEEQGIAKGGHYDLWARQCALDKNQNYSQPEPWLGFRWVAEVVLKDD